MNQKSLGQTGVMLPEIGLGTWQYQGDPSVIKKSLELGGFLIDTAESYGTEKDVGRAVRNQRQEYFIATKVSPENLAYDNLLQCAENSLKRLGTSWIDLYQIHFPNPKIPIAGTMKAMAHLVNTGKIRFVGVSNFSAQQFQEAQEAIGDIPIVCNQVEYSLFEQTIKDDFLPYSTRHRITVMAYSPLAQGRIDPELKKRPHLAKVLDGIADTNQMTRAQVLLAWCIHHPQVITIPQTNNVERVAENISAAGGGLTEEQYSALTDASN